MMPEQHNADCPRCDDTGWIIVGNSFPMSYRGAGILPDDARGCVNSPCDECDMGNETLRADMKESMRHD